MVGMELMEAIRGRRSVRKYEERPIPRELLTQVIEAGTWAPSGGNIQPVRYVVVDDPRTVAKIQTISPGMIGSRPAAVIVVATDKKLAYELGGELGRDTMSLMDASMATQNILLAAYGLGLGTCVVKSFSPRAVAALLGLPDHVVPELLVSVGYPAEVPPAPRRRDLSEILHWGRYVTGSGVAGPQPVSGGRKGDGQGG